MRCFESRFEIAGSQRLIAPLAAGAWSVKLRVSRAIPQVSVLFKTYAGFQGSRAGGGRRDGVRSGTINNSFGTTSKSLRSF